MRPRAVIYTEDANAGGDRWFLDRLLPESGDVTRITGLRWSTSCPGGDIQFSADLTAPANLTHAGLHAGRRVYIQSGGSVRWSGFLDEPQRGEPWKLSGAGLAAMVKTWASTGAVTAGLDATIDAAISRGLPWSRPASLDTATHLPQNTTLDSVLNDVGKATGKVWTLSAAGAIALQAVPKTTVDYVLDVTEPLNPVLQGYTQAIAFYNGNANVAVSNTAAQTKFGKREGVVDLSSLSTAGTTITAANATTYATSWLNARLANWSYANTLTAHYGQLKVPGGGPVDLATVRAGCNVLVTDVDPTHESLLTPGQLTMLVGATDYDADNDVLTLTPIGMRGQNLAAIIYQALGGP